MLDLFSATLEKIYAAAADAARWEEALRAVEDYTGSTGAVLNLVPRQAEVVPIAIAGSFSTSDCADYAQNYMWRCPRIAFGQSHPEIPIHFDSMILSESEMDRDATYEWYGRHGLRYYVAGWIGETGTHRAYMSLQRSRRQGHVGSEDVAQFTLVVKHMAQALALAVKLGTLEQQSRFQLRLIEALPNAVFALDGSGHLLVTNSNADQVLRQGDALVAVGHRLECRVPCDQPLLDRLIAAALGSDPLQPKGGWARIHRTSGLRPYVAFVAALDQTDDMFSALQPKVLLIVADPTAAIFPDQQALHELFGLTDAEARLASAISGGHSMESAAALLNMQLATARSHLKSIFAKLGVHRQQDLVRLMASLSSIGF